jgi:hypothetical protein
MVAMIGLTMGSGMRDLRVCIFAARLQQLVQSPLHRSTNYNVPVHGFRYMNLYDRNHGRIDEVSLWSFRVISVDRFGPES